MKIRCIVVDDEQPARDELIYLLSAFEDVDVVGQADSADSAVDLIKDGKPDLVFLDIQMPGKDGFHVVSRLADMDSPPCFVFATAYDQYAVKAFEKSAVDYLMKPIAKDRLTITLERVRQRMDEKPSIPGELKSLLEIMGAKSEVVRISVEKKGRIHLINPEDIVFCQYEDKRIMVFTRKGAYPIYGIATMDKLEHHLAGGSFFRCHRGTLVNLNHIKEFSPWFNGKYNLIMDDGARSEISVSRSRVKDFKIRLGI